MRNFIEERIQFLYISVMTYVKKFLFNCICGLSMIWPCACMYVCMYVCMFVCVYVCLCVRVWGIGWLPILDI